MTAAFPNVLGSIDGTLIPIKRPSQDEHLYVSRKGSHAINTQVVCDANLVITNIVAKWPGSTHDSFVWNTCNLQNAFERNAIGSGWILGDSGYPCQPYLLTPILNPACQNERRYNVMQRKTRNTSERCIGVWKMRFLCLHKFGGCLMFSPARCVNVIVATAILHNICVRHNVPLDVDLPDDEREQEEDDDGQQQQDQGAPQHAGVRVRRALIQQLFA